MWWNAPKNQSPPKRSLNKSKPKIVNQNFGEEYVSIELYILEKTNI